MIENVYFNNIANEAELDTLTDALVSTWPYAFQGPRDEGSLAVRLYRNEGKTSATAYGILADFQRMECEGETLKLFGRDIRIKPDTGDKRDEKGEFVNPMHGTERHQKDLLFGKTSRKLTVVFNTKFLGTLGYFPLQLEKKAVYFNLDEISPAVFHYAGHIAFQNIQELPPRLCKVEYSSILTAIQATSMFSNFHTDCTTVTVWDKSGTKCSRCTRAKGLGNPEICPPEFQDGLLIDIDEFQRIHKYVPFDHIDPVLLNQSFLRNGQVSYCWRCRKPYKLLGISRDLNYIAGKCECVYNGGATTQNNRSAYTWSTDEEKFTRLAGGQVHAEDSRSFQTLSIWHEPMKRMYLDPKEYSRIVLPVIEDEWKESCAQFRKLYRHAGILTHSQFIEVNPDKPNSSSYALEISVRQTKEWNLTTCFAVKDLNLLMKFRNKDHYLPQEKVSGHLWRIKPIDSTHIRLCISIQCKKWLTPVWMGQVEILPKPAKTQYKSTRKQINQLVRLQENGGLVPPEDDEDNDILHVHPYLSLFLKSRDGNVADAVGAGPINWSLDTTSLVDLASVDRMQLPLDRILGRLNNEQMTAHNLAIKNSVSFINGPPGTGKTFTAVSIALTLALSEKGHIILTAPSNVACDNLAQQAVKLCRKIGLKISIVRMMAKSKEVWGTPTDVVHLNADGIGPRDEFPILHKLVQTHPEWNDPEITHIFDIIRNQNDHFLKMTDRTKFSGHILKLEKKILRQFKMVVCTVGAMSDSRIKSVSKSMSFDTLLMEEAGQMTQPELLATTIVHPKRVIFVGDYLQLPATLVSQSAIRAGLAKSTLEWSGVLIGRDVPGAVTPPFTGLKEQYRMAPDICTLVSKLTYKGELRCGPSIYTRPHILPNLRLAFPQLKAHQSVLLFDKRQTAEQEERMGMSYRNIHEAVRVTTIVTKLLKINVPPERLVILSPYEAQRLEILNHLSTESELQQESLQKANYKAIRVMNVDAFQGQEEAIVIVSLVRSNNKRNIGFVSTLNRLNVTLSRAMYYLFIVGDMETFKSHGSYSSNLLFDLITEIAAKERYH